MLRAASGDADHLAQMRGWRAIFGFCQTPEMLSLLLAQFGGDCGRSGVNENTMASLPGLSQMGPATDCKEHSRQRPDPVCTVVW